MASGGEHFQQRGLKSGSLERRPMTQMGATGASHVTQPEPSQPAAGQLKQAALSPG